MAAQRILIVEDDPLLLEALERAFRHSGFEVFVAKEGVAALEMALQYQPSVILLDLLLPRLGGLAMLEKVRNYDWGKTVAVVVLTNFDEPGLIQEANTLGATDYLVKANYQLSDIVGRVKTLVKRTG